MILILRSHVNDPGRESHSLVKTGILAWNILTTHLSLDTGHEVECHHSGLGEEEWNILQETRSQ